MKGNLTLRLTSTRHAAHTEFVKVNEASGSQAAVW